MSKLCVVLSTGTKANLQIKCYKCMELYVTEKPKTGSNVATKIGQLTNISESCESVDRFTKQADCRGSCMSAYLTATFTGKVNTKGIIYYSYFYMFYG